MRTHIFLELASTLSILLVGCSSSSAPHARARLELSISGGAVQVITGVPQYDATDIRLTATVKQAPYTIFLSVSYPSSAEQQDLSQAREATLWVQYEGMQPLIATSGTISTSSLDDGLSLSIVDASKNEDQFGADFIVDGELLGLRVP